MQAVIDLFSAFVAILAAAAFAQFGVTLESKDHAQPEVRRTVQDHGPTGRAAPSHPAAKPAPVTVRPRISPQA
jgi:hypothetical protein